MDEAIKIYMSDLPGSVMVGRAFIMTSYFLFSLSDSCEIRKGKKTALTENNISQIDLQII